jgi:hypothetical protein
MKKMIALKKIIAILISLSIYSTTFYSTTLFAQDLHYPSISQDKNAQHLFEKGMLNYYGYLYVQAEYDFRQALTYDHNCAMCYWGLAIAKKHQALELGKNFAKLGYSDIQKASQVVLPKNEFQYDLIQAAHDTFSLDSTLSPKQLQTNYINSLRILHEKYKNNNEWKEESLALLVDAIFYYSNVDDNNTMNHCGKPVSEEYKKEALGLMTSALNYSSYANHPGILHTYIHMAENIDNPLTFMAAEKLPNFSQGEIAHYTHMPNHIYWRRGLYDKAIKANFDAMEIDHRYFKQGGVGLNSYYYEYHYLHSPHFLTVLGVLTNNFDLSIKHARMIKNRMDVNRMEDLKDYRDVFFSLEHLVLARFNKWNEVLTLKTPEQTHELGLLFINFSKALAYLNLGENKSFKKLYLQMKNQKYDRKNMVDLQTLAVTYLRASQMKSEHASLEKIEQLFIKNKINDIEHGLYSMNPPLWFFPYQLFLSQTAKDKSDFKLAKEYHDLYEKIYPHSTL